MVQKSKTYSIDWNLGQVKLTLLQIFQCIIFISNLFFFFFFAVLNIGLYGVNTNQATGIRLDIVGTPEHS